MASPRVPPSPLVQHFVAAVGEFVGTFLFLFYAFMWHEICADSSSSTTSTGGPTSQTIAFISLGYGMSLLVTAWTFYRISGGLFNPSVLLGLVLAGQLPLTRTIYLFPAELLGAICAAAVADVLTPGSIVTTQTLLGAGVSVVQGLFIEMFLTMILIFTILMLAAEKSKVTFMAPLAIGLSLFVAELAGVGFTGGSLNFARSLGPAVVSRNFPGYFWIYFVGPLLGAGLTSGFYHFVKVLDYEKANAGQDSANGEFGTADPSPPDAGDDESQRVNQGVQRRRSGSQQKAAEAAVRRSNSGTRRQQGYVQQSNSMSRRSRPVNQWV